jgi:hypothetical protein
VIGLESCCNVGGREGLHGNPLKKGMECAENRLKRGRYANSSQVQEMDGHGAGLIEG